MAEVSAAAVKAFRERTGLPLMDCKKALAEAGGDEEKAIQWLREKGEKLSLDRADRETAFGRFGLYFDDKVGAMVELRCESAPVTQNDEFYQLAQDLAQQLATGPGAETAEALLDQPSPSQKGKTLGEQKNDLFNRIREVFNVGRIVRLDGPCGGYEHKGAVAHGVLIEAAGGTPEQLKDIAMHVAAIQPSGLRPEDLDPALVAKERELLRTAALNEGKPENIVDKIVEGQLRKFYSERVLLEQEFVKDSSLTVGKFAKQNGIEIKQFVHWQMKQG